MTETDFPTDGTLQKLHGLIQQVNTRGSRAMDRHRDRAQQLRSRSKDKANEFRSISKDRFDRFRSESTDRFRQRMETTSQWVTLEPAGFLSPGISWERSVGSIKSNWEIGVMERYLLSKHGD